jgi:hypothetical protein
MKWKGDNVYNEQYNDRYNIMQQVKAWYIYILGVKRLDFIIKSWITRKLLSFSQPGRLESPQSRLLINDHLYKKYIEANSYCSCQLVETSEHFLLKCSLYERLRNDLFVNLSSHLNINNLLCGDSNLPGCENESNFLVIQDFIIKSKRFTPKI